jgi:hypothetical protein
MKKRETSRQLTELTRGKIEKRNGHPVVYKKAALISIDIGTNFKIYSNDFPSYYYKSKNFPTFTNLNDKTIISKGLYSESRKKFIKEKLRIMSLINKKTFFGISQLLIEGIYSVVLQYISAQAGCLVFKDIDNKKDIEAFGKYLTLLFEKSKDTVSYLTSKKTKNTLITLYGGLNERNNLSDIIGSYNSLYDKKEVSLTLKEFERDSTCLITDIYHLAECLKLFKKMRYYVSNKTTEGEICTIIHEEENKFRFIYEIYSNGSTINLSFDYKNESLDTFNFVLNFIKTIVANSTEKLQKNRTIPYQILPLAYEVFESKKRQEDLYTFFQINTGKKVRDIYAPIDPLKTASSYLLKYLSHCFDKAQNTSEIHAYVHKKSIVTNALAHCENKFIYKTDIKGFFDNCKKEAFKKWFPQQSNLQYISDLIYEGILNPNTGGLYQGNPISGMLSNFIMKPIIRIIHFKLLKSEEVSNSGKFRGYTDWKYTITVYADDITVSCNHKFSKNFMTNLITDAFREANTPFILNENKTFLMTNQKRSITGVKINHLDAVTMKRSYYNILRSMLERIFNKKEDRREVSFKFLGKLEFLLYIDKSRKLLRYMSKFLLIDNGSTTFSFPDNECNLLLLVQKFIKHYNRAFNTNITMDSSRILPNWEE